MAQINLNLAGIAPAVPFGTVPAGDYNVKIVKSDVKPNKAQTGHYLELELEILDGEFKGRHLFDSLNLWNPNETAVRIANATMAAIAQAVGVGPEIPDSEILHDRPLCASVKLEKGNAEYPDDKNRVKGYTAFKNGSAPVAMAPAFVPPAPVAPVAAPAPVAPVAPPAPAFAPAAVPVAAPSFAPPAGLPAFAPPAPAAAPQSFAPPAVAPATAPVPMAPVMAPPPAFAVPGAAPAPMAPAAGAPAPFAWQAQS